MYSSVESESDDELNGAVPQGDAVESLAELVVAVGRLGELEFVRAWLKVVAEEGGVVAVPRRVDPDPEGGSGCVGRPLASETGA